MSEYCHLGRLLGAAPILEHHPSLPGKNILLPKTEEKGTNFYTIKTDTTPVTKNTKPAPQLDCNSPH